MACLAAAAMSVQPALAQTTDCISMDEMGAGARFLMPVLVQGVASKCVPVLGPGSYLATTSEVLTQRFAPLDGDDAKLAALIEKVDKDGAMKGLDIPTIKAVSRVKIPEAVIRDLKPNSCPTIDKILALLDPLPSENMISIVTLIAREVETDNKRKAALKDKGAPAQKTQFCPAE